MTDVLIEVGPISQGALLFEDSSMNATIKSIAKAILPRKIAGVFQSPNDRYRLADGTTLHLRDNHADREVLNQVFVRKEYALERSGRLDLLTAFYQNTASPLIIDAGANIGAATVWFSRAFPRARIVAVEPDRGNYALLCRNVDQLETVTSLNAAIASEPGTLLLTDPGEGTWSFRTSNDPSANGYPVVALTIEGIIEQAGDGVPFILKIDIEGAEADLFSRHAEVFDRFPLVIIELHDWMLPKMGTSKNFLEWHLATNRDFVFSGENVFSMSRSLC